MDGCRRVPYGTAPRFCMVPAYEQAFPEKYGLADAGFRSESHEALLWAIGTQRSTSLFATQMTHLYCQVKYRYSPTSFSVPGYYRYWTWICRNLIYQLHLPCSFLLFFILAVRVGGRGVVLSITASFSSPPRNYLNRNPPHNIAQEPILYSPRIGEIQNVSRSH